MWSAHATQVAKDSRSNENRLAYGLVAAALLLAGAALLAAPVTAALPGALVPVAAPANLAASAVGHQQFAFALENAWPADGLLTVNLPDSYLPDAGAPSVASFVAGCSGTFGAGTSLVSAGVRALTFARQGGSDCAALSAVTVRITNIANPAVSGVQELTVRTKTAAGATVDAGTTTATIAGFLRVVDVVPTSTLAGAFTSYRFDLQTQGTWPANGNLTVTFPFAGAAPAASDIVAAGATAATGVGCASFGTLTVVPPSAPPALQTLVLRRTGNGSPCGPGDAFSVTVTGMRNQAYAGAPALPTVATQAVDRSTIDSNQRAVSDGVLASNTAVTSATAAFTAADVGALVRGAGIPPGITIAAVTSPSAATLSSSAATTATGVALTVTRPIQRDVLSSGLVGATAMPGSFRLGDVGSRVLGANFDAATTITAVGASATIFPAALSDFTSATLQRATIATFAPGALTVATAAPANPVAGRTTSYTFAFTSANAIPADGRIALGFPSDYADFSGIGAATLAGPTGCASGAIAVTVAAPRVTLARSGGQSCAAGALTVTLTGVRNPGQSGLPALTVQTEAVSPSPCAPAQPCVIDLAPAVVAPIQPAPLAPVVDVAFADGASSASAASRHKFTFTTTNPWPAGGRFAVTFPAGYRLASLSGMPAASPTGCDGTLSLAAVSGQVATLQRVGATDCPAGRAVTFTLGDLPCTGCPQNPAAAGVVPLSFCTVAAAYPVGTSCGAAGTIDEASDTLEVTPGLLPLPPVPVSAADLKAGALTAYTFRFGTLNGWPADGAFAVTFPAGYDLSGVPASPAVGAQGPPSCTSGSFTAARAGQTVTVQRSGAAGACSPGSLGLELTVAGIRNPGVEGLATWPAKAATTTTASGARIDETAASMSLTILPGALQDLAVPAATSRAAGATTAYDFTFRLRNAWPATGTLTVGLPAGFGAGTLSATGTGCAVGSASLETPSLVRVTRSGTECAAGSLVTIRVAGLRNPPVAGPVTFALTTWSGALRIDAGSPPAATIDPALPTAIAMAPTTRAAGAVATYQFQFTLANPWPLDGRLQIAFPTGFDATSVAIATPLPACLGFASTAPAGPSPAPQTVTAARSGATCPAGTAVTFTASGVRNPSTAGVHSISFTTQDAAGNAIDQASVSTGIGATTPVAPVPRDPAPGALTVYDLAATLQSAWPDNGVMAITFPTGYSLGAITATTTCTGTLTPTVGQPLLLARAGAVACPPGPVTVSIAGITNPVARGTTGAFAIEFRDGAGNLLQAHTGQAFIAHPAQRVTAADTRFTGIAANQELALQAVVRDASGLGVPGVPVLWSMESGGDGFWNATHRNANGSFGRLEATLTTLTDGSGVATALFRNDGTAQAIAKATPQGATLQGSPLRYTVNPPGASALGSTSAPPIQVTPSLATVSADAGTVTLAVTGAGTAGALLGDLTSGSTFTVAPDGSCVANVCTMLKAGPHTVTATRQGAQATTVVNVTAGAVRSLAAMPVTGAALLAPGSAATLQAKATDLNGNPVPGATVAWVVAAGGGSLSATTATTGADGTASVTLTTGSAGGANSVTATHAALPAATFAVTTASVQSLQAVAASFAGIPAGTAQALQARVTGPSGSPLAGITVNWAVRSGTGTLSAATAVTDTTGTATTTYTGTLVGAATIEATAAGATPVAFTVATVAGPLDRLTVSPGSALADPGSDVAFTVTGVDAYGNTVSDLTSVAVLAIAPDGTCTATRCQAAANGFHTVTATAAGKTGTATLNAGEAARDDVAGTANASPGLALLAMAVVLLGAALLRRR